MEELKTPADEPAVRIRAEMEQFGFTEADMVVGLPWYVELGLSVMGIPAPTPPDYRAPLPAAGQATGAQGDLGVARPEEARWHAHSVPV